MASTGDVFVSLAQVKTIDTGTGSATSSKRDQYTYPDLRYNVSQFLRQWYGKTPAFHIKVAEGTKILDDKVCININDDRFAPIDKGIQQIMHHIENIGLKTIQSTVKCDVYRTGSTYAGTRVGLPFEADYLIKLYPRPEVDNNAINLSSSLKEICQSGSFKACFDNPDQWQIIDVSDHNAGVCLRMEYCAGETETEAIGVLLDLVLVTHTEKTIKYSSISKLINATPEAEKEFSEKKNLFLYNLNIKDKKRAAALGKSSTRPITKEQFFDNKDIDLGGLENWILRHQDEGTKQGFRVAKYLLQQCHFKDPLFRSHDTRRTVQLYGYKPAVKSFLLRLCFLNLLQVIKGRPEEHHLKSGLLALCLLDIMLNLFDKRQYQGIQETFTMWLPHPTISWDVAPFWERGEKWENFTQKEVIHFDTNTCVKINGKLSQIIQTFVNRIETQDMSQYSI